MTFYLVSALSYLVSEENLVDDKQVRSARWLVLSNLSQGWPYHTNLSRELFADEALAWAERQGYVVEGKITDAGRGALVANKLD